jgi:N-methylhydantoinase B
MSNTRNTPAEALEYHYPVRVRHYAVREGSAGTGRRSGGDGVVREVELLAPATVALLTERRTQAPYGLNGGEDALPGRNEVDTGCGWRELPGKTSETLPAGARLRISTPGGGGWGTSDR